MRWGWGASISMWLIPRIYSKIALNRHNEQIIKNKEKMSRIDKRRGTSNERTKVEVMGNTANREAEREGTRESDVNQKSGLNWQS